MASGYCERTFSILTGSTSIKCAVCQFQ
ncbi:hypothetical protein ACFL6U_06765 [Planctomycetota bacterium]